MHRTLSGLLLSGALLSNGALAQGVTIGGTPADGEVTGIMAMFTGDLFDNFRHMERFVPTAEVAPSTDPWDLGESADSLSFTGDFLGEPIGLEEFIQRSNTSAFLVFKDDKLIYERYAHGDSKDSLHVSFSVAKSFVATLVGIALAEGKIDSLEDPIRKYLPELTSPTFENVTVEQVLQMSSGVRFNETYTDPSSDINKMTLAVQEISYLEYINGLGRDHPPGTFNHYASINTQLLGILLVKVTGQSLTEYTQQKLWQPMGMEQRGLWTLDEQGYELAMGGLAASARDYAKLGLVYLNDGQRGGQRVLPEGWVKAAVTPDADHLMPGNNPASSNTAGYQYQWWTPRQWDGDFLARGIWGQNIYVHPKNRVVIVKLAADPTNFNTPVKLAYIDYLQDIAQSLAD